jgi:hypothetical protein
MQVNCICQKCEKLVHYYDEYEEGSNPIEGVFFDGDSTTWLCKECDTPENRQEIYDAVTNLTYKPAYECSSCYTCNELLTRYCEDCKKEYDKRMEKK